MSKVEIIRIDVSTRKASFVRDCVAQEKPLHIFVNRTPYATVFCSPSNLKELTVGHLLSEAIIRNAREITEVEFEDKYVCRVRLRPDVNLHRRLRHVKVFPRISLLTCEPELPCRPKRRFPKIRSDLTVEATVVLDCMKRLNLIAETFRKTGGVHVAAIFKENGMLVELAEDIGRHNSVDKAIGAGALTEVDFASCFLALSGRLTGDIVSKAANVGLPIVASLSAAIDSGIAIAEKTNLTLIGFARGKHMNIYNCADRVTLDSRYASELIVS